MLAKIGCQTALYKALTEQNLKRSFHSSQQITCAKIQVLLFDSLSYRPVVVVHLLLLGQINL